MVAVVYFQRVSWKQRACKLIAPKAVLRKRQDCADSRAVYTTPAPKGTLTNSVNNRKPSTDVAPKVAAQAAATTLAMPAAGTGSRNVSATQSLPPGPTTAQSSLPSTASRTSLPNAATTAGRALTFTSDSPVMSETLSVIDEHITDMKSPRTSYANGLKRDTLGSVYSHQPSLNRRSYIAGAETDEEEHQLHTEEEVMSWGPERTAEYLEDNGVEKAHCDIFREQEISGEVLLAMDQNSLFIKEFELGAIGRRLKTWHKIKALQDEVRRTAHPEPERDRSVSEYSLAMDAEEGAGTMNVARNRSSTVGAPSLPRGLSPAKRQSGDNLPIRGNSAVEHGAFGAPQGAVKRSSLGVSPLQAMTSTRPENTYRPSAQGIRNLNHSRRHSSIDSTSTDGASRIGHRKKASIDQKWEPAPKLNGHAHTASTDLQFPQRKSSALAPASPEDLDRGYFSSTEVDSRSRKTTLTKRNSTTVSPMNSRTASFLDTTPEFREPVSPVMAPSSHQSSAMKAISNKFGNYRSATSPVPNRMSPIVTKLDHGSNPSLSAIAASPTKISDTGSDVSSDKATPAPTSSPRINFGMFSSAKAKVTGLRSISDAVTKEEKMSPTRVNQPLKSPTRTGSSTPSTEGKSLDLSKSDMNSRASTGSGNNLMPPPTKKPRARTKTKKSTSAYTRGLEKKPPQEALLNCDYSGWMKKKSGSLMTTWKTRLFILRGCRLSYYYADDDTEEKGLIDISFHKVIRADDDKVTGLHATLTGATGGQSSPMQGSTPTMAEKDLKDKPPPEGENESLFIFKLVPPKAGLSKAVNFTKPTVHYFAVNSRQEGRLWMAALMKATIDRDDNGVVTTTYNQKTISLAKARARRERPPGLKDPDEHGSVELGAGDDEASDRGLGIVGYDEKDATTAGAEENGGAPDVSSIAPSTVAETVDSELNEKEREAVALNA